MIGDPFLEKTKSAKAGYVSLIVIIGLLLLTILTLFVFPQFYNIFFWIFLIAQVAFAIILSFDGFRNYSQYGLSRNHQILNQVVSIAAVAAPFASILFNLPVLLALAFFLNGLNLWRSPAIQTEPSAKLGPRHPATREFIKAFLWLMIYAVMVLYGLIYAPAHQTDASAPTQQTETLQESR